MLKLEFTERLKYKYPDAAIGLLLINNIQNYDNNSLLDTIKRNRENYIKDRYSEMSREEILADETLKAYKDYYRKFKKTYHLLLQLESIAKTGRLFPTVNPLVDTCFLSEMKTFVLTAGHDADLIKDPALFDLSGADDEFTQINGKSIILKPDDIIMKSGNLNICSIIYGQDESTCISHETKNALFAAYAPAGVSRDTVLQNMDDIKNLIMQFSVSAETQLMDVFSLSP